MKDEGKSKKQLLDEINSLRNKNIELEREQKETQDMIIQEEKLTFAGRMAATIAHEIRNPLNIINMSVQQMHNKLKKKDPNREYTKMIMGNIGRVEKLISDFVDIAKPPKLKLEWYSINNIIQDILNFMKPQYSQRKAKVAVNLDRKIPRIKLDKERITQAFTNILINSCEALPKKGGRTWVNTKRNEDYIAIKFGNKGKTIPKKDMIRIFDPFFSSKKTGTGLGLSITYTVIGTHRGTISVESNKKIGGTVFFVKLPI